MVFDLVDDQPDRIHWLPRTQEHLELQAAKLDSEDFHVREHAFDEILAHVDLGESVAKRLVEHHDAEVAWRAKVLLHRIAVSREEHPIPTTLPVNYGNQAWSTLPFRVEGGTVILDGQLDLQIIEE